MKLRYFLRGLGAGIIFTAVVMGISGKAKEPVMLTDNEIMARARALGMVTKEEKIEEELNGLLEGIEEKEKVEEDKKEEQKTEEQFYAFVHELSIGNESSGTLVCSDFRNGNQALSFILTLISTDVARKAFNEKTEYDSDWLTLKFTEDNIDGRFARLMLKFKKREDVPSYTVVFALANR